MVLRGPYSLSERGQSHGVSRPIYQQPGVFIQSLQAVKNQPHIDITSGKE